MPVQLFKWLMALVVMIGILWLLENCQNLRKTDFKHSDEYLRERVQKIYANVTLFYNRLDALRQNGEGGPTQWPDFDSLYCSEDWNRHVASVMDIDEKREGETGFFEWDYWTCSKDYAFMYATDIETIDRTGDQGTVSLVLHNGDMKVPVLLNMVYERGDWYIDEMTNNWNRLPDLPYFEWKSEMKEYIKSSCVPLVASDQRSSEELRVESCVG
ncbi:MAG: hypothetical protein IJT53_04505 [Prevotella sp.]|nr:hypothetical protein [Prevotella sp.]